MIARRAFACFVALASASACGLGHSDNLGDGGAPPGDDSGTPSSVCPSSQPASGASCPISFTGACEYGTDPNPSCNATVVCTKSGWALEKASFSNACPTPPAGSSCPGSYAQAKGGGSCTTEGVTCGYAEGYCACTVPSFGPVQLDASASLRWVCDDPSDAACPLPRPRVGAACAASSITCDYGACSLPSGVTLACPHGFWETTPTACPLLF